MQLVPRLPGKAHSSGALGSTKDEEGGHNPMVLGYLLCCAWQQVPSYPCCLTFTTQQRKHFTEEVP